MERYTRAFVLGVLAALVCLLPALSNTAAQIVPAQPGQLPPIDAKTQGAIIDSVTAVMNKNYVFGDIAARMDSLLKAGLASGVYRDLTDPANFLMRLDRDMHSVYNDRHLRLGALAPLPPGTAEKPAQDPRDTEEYKERLRRTNYGFRKVEILPGNIGYLDFTMFADASIAGETAVGAMNFLANTDALIIDLRNNGGGNASMIQLLASYFFEEPQHLVSWIVRGEDRTDQSWSHAYVPGKRMFETPLYILTSDRTFSAAEEFTYDLKNPKRATVVGDTTGGGAHTVADHAFDFVSFRVGIRVPSGRAISPITKTNWEGTGIVPDIVALTDQALIVAQVEALKKLQEKAADERVKSSYAWAQAGLESQLHPMALSAKELRWYVGEFGPRKFFIEGAELMYQREGRPQYALVPMGNDLFGVKDLEFFRIRFSRDAKGRIDGMIGMYDDGREDRNDKTK